MIYDIYRGKWQRMVDDMRFGDFHDLPDRNKAHCLCQSINQQRNAKARTRALPNGKVRVWKEQDQLK